MLKWLISYPIWLYKYIKLKLGFNTLRDIKILSIEFSSVCNLRCKYCFLEQGDRTRFLDLVVYEKLIKEVAENPKFRIRTMEWPISGEFFVYKQWKEVIDITKKYWDANPNFRPHIILNENFMLFDEERIEYVLKSGIVRQIICSVDGHDAKTFEDMRPPAKFDKVLKHFRILAKKNKELGSPVFLQVNNGRDENSKGKKFTEEMVEIFNEGHDVTFWNPQFWNESFNKSDKKFYPAKGFCTFVFNNVTLSSNGHISKCCMDLKGTTTYSDLKESSLEEIWHSKIRKQFMDAMFNNNRSKIEGCNTCSITATNNDNRFNNFVRKIRRVALPQRRKEYQAN